MESLGSSESMGSGASFPCFGEADEVIMDSMRGPQKQGGSLRQGPFSVPFYRGAIVYWGPKKGPWFRERPNSTFCSGQASLKSLTTCDAQGVGRSLRRCSQSLMEPRTDAELDCDVQLRLDCR